MAYLAREILEGVFYVERSAAVSGARERRATPPS
jgi:hypothetical protein